MKGQGTVTDSERINYITSQVIKAAIAVHKALGPGLLESVYQRCMILELEAMGLKVASDVPVAVKFRGTTVHDRALKLDLLVEDVVVVELKSVEELKPVFFSQLLTYLRLSEKQVGLLINFNVVLLKDGIHRIVNGYRDET
jgi:GxxExxY protein